MQSADIYSNVENDFLFNPRLRQPPVCIALGPYSVAYLFNTRSSATAEKQRVSCACLPRLAN